MICEAQGVQLPYKKEAWDAKDAKDAKDAQENVTIPITAAFQVKGKQNDIFPLTTNTNRDLVSSEYKIYQ